MFLPKRHLLSILQPDPIGQSVRLFSVTPEGAVFYFGDFEVNGFGACGVWVLDDDADDAGGEEMADCLGGEDGAVPVGDGVLGYWGEGTGHDCGGGL